MEANSPRSYPGLDSLIGADNDPYTQIHPNDWSKVAGPSSATLPVSPSSTLQKLEEEYVRACAALDNLRSQYPFLALSVSTPTDKIADNECSTSYVGKGKGRAV
jgi:hypothetical protein